MELVSEAALFAIEAHDGMRRKSTDIPYILHPMEAAAIVGSLTSDQEVIAAAVLHDVVEDAGVTLEQVAARFGRRVAQLVASETENKREHLPAGATWRIRKQESIGMLQNTDDIAVKMLYLGDKLANMRSIHRDWVREGEVMWSRFHQKDPAQQGWYYRAIADATTVLCDTPAWQEYDWLIKTVFERGM